MARLSRSEIERKLLRGMAVTWNDANGKQQQLLLSSPKARNLLRYLLKSSVRNPTSLSNDFVAGLADAYENGQDPASSYFSPSAPPSPYISWRLKAIETEGFGGINIWKGPKFRFEFDTESLLMGPTVAESLPLPAQSYGLSPASAHAITHRPCPTRKSPSFKQMTKHC